MKRFPLSVAAAFLALLVGYRLWIGAGFGLGLFGAEGGAVPSGFLYNESDNFSYAAWAKQGELGAIRFTNLYTTDEHGSVYFNPYFWFVGTLASLFGVRVTGLLVVFGIAASALTIVCSFHIARRAGLSPVAARWTTLLVAFASGLSWPVIAVAHRLGAVTPTVGADLSFQDAIPFSAAFAYPFQSASLALLATMILLALRCEEQNGGSRRRLAFAALACGAGLMGTMRPYEGIMFLGTYAVYATWSALRGKRTQLAVGCVLLACIGPGIGYAFWVSRQPVWREFAAGLDELGHPRTFWMIGYGLVLPIALITSIAELRGRSSRWWFAAWTLIVAGALIGFNLNASKVSSGAFLPMSLMAGHGIAKVAKRAGRIRAKAARRIALATGFLLSTGFFPTSAYLLARIYENRTYDAGIAQAARIIQASDTRHPKVLCDTRAGLLLPVLAGARVFAGHWAVTPQSSSKRDRLIRAGIQRQSGAAQTAPNPQVFHDLVEEIDVDFILLREQSPAVPYADGDGQIELTSVHAPWRLYRRR